MKTIFVVSPDYLDVLYHEAIKYDFVLQGYGDVSKALQGLLQVNVSDVLGFVVLADNIESIAEDLYNLFFAIDLIESPKKLLLVSRGSNPFDIAVLKKDYPHVNFHQLLNLEVITDEIINREVFGSILLDNYEPYIFDNKKSLPIKVEKTEYLSFDPVIPSYVTDCLNEVLIMNTVDQTLEADTVFSRYDKDKSKLLWFRKNYIYKVCGVPIDEDRLLRIIEEERGNSFMHCIYYALYELIKDTHGRSVE